MEILGPLNVAGGGGQGGLAIDLRLWTVSGRGWEAITSVGMHPIVMHRTYRVKNFLSGVSESLEKVTK